MLPFTSKNGVPSGFEVRAELRDSIVKTFLSAFPLYERYPEKHIFIDNGDIDRPPPLLRNSILFKICPSYRDFDVLPLPQPTRDPGPPRSITEASIDVSFQGHVDQHPIRQRLASWSRRQTDLRVEFRSTGQSFFVMEANKRAEMASENFELMLRSKFVLSPRGRGTTSRRFFEILAHGRIPIHISDAAKLPLEGLIDYDRFVVRVPEGFVGLTGEYVREFRLQHDLVEASELARCTYVDYFAPQSFRHFIETSLAVRKL